MEAPSVDFKLARRWQVHLVRSSRNQRRRLPIDSQAHCPWRCTRRLCRWIFERAQDQGLAQRHEIRYGIIRSVEYDRSYLPNLGMVAAEAIFSALKEAGEADKSKPLYLSKYPEMLKRSWLWDDLYKGILIHLIIILQYA